MTVHFCMITTPLQKKHCWYGVCPILCFNPYLTPQSPLPCIVDNHFNIFSTITFGFILFCSTCQSDTYTNVSRLIDPALDPSCVIVTTNLLSALCDLPGPTCQPFYQSSASQPSRTANSSNRTPGQRSNTHDCTSHTQSLEHWASTILHTQGLESKVFFNISIPKQNPCFIYSVLVWNWLRPLKSNGSYSSFSLFR